MISQVIAIGIALWGIGCSKSSPRDCPPDPGVAALSGPDPAPDDHFCEPPKPPECNLSQCGGNSQVINTFPINGLRSDGECNLEGVQLVPRSLHGGQGNKCEGATLGIVDNELVGIDNQNAVKCKAGDLKEATFDVRSHVAQGSGKKTLTVHIAEVSPYTHTDSGETRTAYRMTVDGASLCKASASATARDALGLGLIDGLTDPDDSKAVVIPVWSELYTRAGQAVAVKGKWKRQTPEWLHLACVDDALAKRSLNGLFTDNVTESRSALGMLVARYCFERHVTMRGVRIAWKLADDATAKPAAGDILEAKWGPDGALCLSAPRLLYKDGLPPHIPSDLPADSAQICPTCKTPQEWTAAVRLCRKVPGSAKPGDPAGTDDKPIDDCASCTTAACKARGYRSYLVPK